MVRLVKPEERHSIYDPCGWGGMLIPAKEYIDEHGGKGNRAELCGQEANGTVWSIAKMNMLLHGISNADLRNDDTWPTRSMSMAASCSASTACWPTRPSHQLGQHRGRQRPQARLPAQVRGGALPLRPGAAGQQEGRPDVPAAHGGRAARRRPARHRCRMACCSVAARSAPSAPA